MQRLPKEMICHRSLLVEKRKGPLTRLKSKSQPSQKGFLLDPFVRQSRRQAVTRRKHACRVR